MPVNPYDDCRVSLRRPQGNGDLDIVRESYTCHKANVTEALRPRALKIWHVASPSGSLPSFFSNYTPGAKNGPTPGVTFLTQA